MTANTPQQDKVTAQELRDWMKRVEESLRALVTDLCTTRDEMCTVREEMLELREDTCQMDDALRIEVKTLANLVRSAPQQPQAGETQLETVVATCIVKSYDPRGQVMLHIQGGRYSRHGARVWPEYAQALGIDADKLKPGPNPYTQRVIIQPAQDGHAPKAISLAQ